MASADFGSLNRETLAEQKITFQFISARYFLAHEFQFHGTIGRTLGRRGTQSPAPFVTPK